MLPSVIKADQPLCEDVVGDALTTYREKRVFLRLSDTIGETCCVVRGAFLWFKVIYIKELLPFFNCHKYLND